MTWFVNSWTVTCGTMTTILIADDDDILVRMYQTKFQNAGYAFLTATNGEQALQKAQSEKPDLMLLDIIIPKIPGLDVLKKLKTDPATKSIPVILLTNIGSSEEHVQAGLLLGAIAYLIKSNYTPAEIVEKVKEILEAHLHIGDTPIPKVAVAINPDLA